MSAKELKDKLKALRSLHSGKAVGKMSPDEINNEISHHETASRQKELKEKRLTALASARDAKKPVVVVEKKVKKEKVIVKEEKPTVIKKEKVAKEEKPKKEKKIKKEKVVIKSSESDTDSSTDEDTDTETIKKRISKKGLANGE